VPVVGRSFGVAHWNPLSDDPAWVLNVGGEELEAVHGMVWNDIHELQGDVRIPMTPEQHAPWVPHICLAYSREDLLTQMEKRVGHDIEFDRLRVVFSGDITDIPLDAGTTAAGTPIVLPGTLPPSGGVEAALEEVARRAVRQGS